MSLKSDSESFKTQASGDEDHSGSDSWTTLPSGEETYSDTESKPIKTPPPGDEFESAQEKSVRSLVEPCDVVCLTVSQKSQELELAENTTQKLVTQENKGKMDEEQAEANDALSTQILTEGVIDAENTQFETPRETKRREYETKIQMLEKELNDTKKLYMERNKKLELHREQNARLKEDRELLLVVIDDLKSQNDGLKCQLEERRLEELKYSRPVKTVKK